MDEQTKRGKEIRKQLPPKEKRENFWYYYKVHVIVAIFAVIVIGLTIYEFANKIEDDLTITYFSEAGISNERVDKLTDFAEQFTKDLNGDAESIVTVSPVSGSLKSGGEQNVAVQAKYASEIGAGHSMGFILDKAYFDILNETYPDIIQEYCVISENPEVANVIGIEDGEELYWVTKALYNSELGKEKRIAMNENAHRVYQAFITVVSAVEEDSGQTEGTAEKTDETTNQSETPTDL